MAKSNTRIVLVTLLAAASFASYLYLNSIRHKNASSIEEATASEAVESELKNLTPDKALLPDVYLLKKALDTGKRLMPTR